MNLKPGIKTLIEHVVNVFETGTPEGNYGEVSIYQDGQNGSLQITYGRSQTTEQGNLRALLLHYVTMNGKYASDFKPYLKQIGQAPTVPGVWPTLARDQHFICLLRAAGSDPVMREAEDQFFDHDYFQPAVDWADNFDFRLPLSLLVIYDSFIHSGSVPLFLRRRFTELVPSQGGDEVEWVTAYVHERHHWLITYHDPTSPEKAALLRTSSYRTQCLLDQIRKGNWYLDQLPIHANDVNVSA